MDRVAGRMVSAREPRKPARPPLHGEHTLRLQIWQRLVVLLVVILALAAAMTSTTIHQSIRQLVDQVAVLVETHPIAGVAAFCLLSILSAMMAFFSTAIVVPVAVYAWGPWTTVALLWSSWLAGGCCAYAIGRTLGRRVASWLVDPVRLDFYTIRIPERAGFFTILLFQFALPSEIPGYVLGALRYRFLIYILALAVTEVPFAVGAVYLGEGLLERNVALLLGLGVSGVATIGIAWRILHRRLAD